MTARIHVGDVGTEITVVIRDQDDMVVDLSQSTIRQIIFRGPGLSFVKDAVLATNGEDGALKYVLADGDIAVAGPWSVQAYIEIATNKWHSELANFQVMPNIAVAAAPQGD